MIGSTMMSSDARMMSSDTGVSSDTRVWEEQQEELRALSPFRRLMRRLNLEALVYESAPFPVLLRKLSALIPACLLWWVIYEPHRLASSTHLPEGTQAITLLPEHGVTPPRGLMEVFLSCRGSSCAGYCASRQWWLSFTSAASRRRARASRYLTMRVHG